MTAPLVVALVAAAALLAAWPADRRLLQRLTPRASAKVLSARPPRWLLVVALGAAGVVLAGALKNPRLGVAWITMLIAGSAAAGLAARAAARRRAERTSAEVVRAAEGLAALLRTGAIPRAALATLASDHPVLAEAAAAEAVGGDAATTFRGVAGEPGKAGLADLAAGWQVAARTGASLGVALDAVCDELARRQEVESTVRVELAASRGAGRLMAFLPGVGVLLGYGLGGDPLAFLWEEPAGWVCLIIAVALAAAGLLWTDRIAEGARR